MGLPFSLAHTHGCAYLATNTPYIGSQPHAILLVGCIAHVEDALPCCCAPSSVSVTLALLPRGDEFRMNFEGLGVSFSTYLLFCVAFLQVGRELRREGAAPSVGA